MEKYGGILKFENKIINKYLGGMLPPILYLYGAKSPND